MLWKAIAFSKELGISWLEVDMNKRKFKTKTLIPSPLQSLSLNLDLVVIILLDQLLLFNPLISLQLHSTKLTIQ